ncbi:MAG: flippase-like domain-containing protein, partial [Methanobacteriales archaeon]|nr:flippase-like domain-containing protein [Methanobacteriales archaeon]
ATVIADRGLDTFPFILLAIITIVSMILYFDLPFIWVISLIVAVILIIVIFILALYVSVDDGAGEKFANWILNTLKFFYKRGYEKWSLRIKNAIMEFQDSMRVMLKEKRVFIYGIPLSFLLWLLEILRVYFIFYAFGANITIIVIAEVFIVATLIGMIPLLPGGLGAIEGAMIILYSTAGISPSISAAVTVVERLISFWMTSILGVACLPYFGAPVVKKLSEKL